MFDKHFLRKYLLRGFIAAAIYCITVVIFLYNKTFQSIWVLFLGSALYMVAIALLVFLSNRTQTVSNSSGSSTISGYVLSLTGAALSVILSLFLYLLFYSGTSGAKGETLHHAPADLSANGATHGMLFVLIVVAALGNTITGFFAALFTSFGVSKKQSNEQAS